MKKFKELLNEIGDTPRGHGALTRYKNRARTSHEVATHAAKVFLARSGDKGSIEGKQINLDKYYKFARIAAKRAKGLERIKKYV